MHLSAEDATAASRAPISHLDAGPALSLSIPQDHRAGRERGPEAVITPLGIWRIRECGRVKMVSTNAGAGSENEREVECGGVERCRLIRRLEGCNRDFSLPLRLPRQRHVVTDNNLASWEQIPRPGPPISLIFNLWNLKNTTQAPAVSSLDEMSDRASNIPPPPSSNAADFQDGFGQLIQHNSSFQHHSHSFEEGSTQMSPGGSPAQGLDDTLYNNGGYQYSNGQEIFQHGLSPNIGLGSGYGDLGYDIKHESSRYAPVPDDPQLYGYGSHEPSPAPSAMSPPPNVRRTRSEQAINRAIQELKPPPRLINRTPSPKPKAKKIKKEKKIKTEKRIARLEEPLSELTRTWTHVPVVDIDAYVNRSAEIRRQEVEEGKNPGKVKRPMNSFMLYRKAYQNRTKNWCLANNHQVVSQVCGDSWPLEPDSVRAQFNEWARIERQNHQNAHPGYKFSPAKAGTAKAAKRKASVSEESELEDFDWNDGRCTKTVKRQKLTPKPCHTPPPKFEGQPYYGFGYNSRGSSMEPSMGGGYPSSTYHASNPGRNVPEPYRPNIPNGQYWQQEVVPNVQNPNIHDVIMRRTRGPGPNVAPHPGYQQECYQHNGAMNGGIAQNPYNGYQDEPDTKIDPSLMGHDQSYDNTYAIDENDVFADSNGLVFNQQYYQQPLAIFDGGQQHLQSLEIPDGMKQEYPEYPREQSGIPDTPILNQQLDDLDGQNVWQIVDSLGAGDEFNNKWMSAESGQEE
ncbi:hypothetical protein V493_04911 [Pseudogymnoascus sp. VKM F-4281 (FW-2241)]|nr:hypothetical protein V493_04911 [Pseudogymnoascus sp. VKM F-4281 (FW-2241)]